MALSHELQRRFDYISSELVLSGSGLDAVHKALCAIDGVEWTPLDVTTILSRAQAGDIICHDICVIRAGGVLQALGDAALINGTRGGVVVTGGVAERLYDYLCEDEALERFFQRGPMSPYMLPIPIRLLTDPQAPLYGAVALYLDGVPAS